VAPYVKTWILRGKRQSDWGSELLKAITLKEIERIFEITDALGISREALVIPLRTDSPGRVRPIAGAKVEIVVDRDADFNQWLNGLEDQLRPLIAKLQG
jgi:hypothetical protein